jgi:hypothetical protein
MTKDWKLRLGSNSDAGQIGEPINCHFFKFLAFATLFIPESCVYLMLSDIILLDGFFQHPDHGIVIGERLVTLKEADIYCLYLVVAIEINFKFIAITHKVAGISRIVLHQFVVLLGWSYTIVM